MDHLVEAIPAEELPTLVSPTVSGNRSGATSVIYARPTASDAPGFESSLTLALISRALAMAPAATIAAPTANA